LWVTTYRSASVERTADIPPLAAEVAAPASKSADRRLTAAVVPPAAGQLRRRRRSCRGTQGRSCAGFGDALHRPPGAAVARAVRHAERWDGVRHYGLRGPELGTADREPAIHCPRLHARGPRTYWAEIIPRLRQADESEQVTTHWQV